MDNNIEISLKNSYLSEIDTKKNNQNKKEKNFNIVAESNLSRSKDNIYLLASYQNLNIIKIFQIDNNENRNKAIHSITWEKPRFMDYLIYYNFEYEESEIFILISTLSEIQAFKFDALNFDYYKTFS